MFTCGLGPMGWAKVMLMSGGDTSSAAPGAGALLSTVLSAANAGVDHEAATSAAVSNARHQRSAERVDDLVEFFKVLQR
jgi:hypothetical protein